LQFETERGTVTGYVSQATDLKTQSGVTVGDPFSLIEGCYGDQLERSRSGKGTSIALASRPAAGV